MVTTINQAIDLVEAICHLPKNRTMITWRERRIRNSGLKRAIAAHDTAYLYSWLMEMFSYQGISDTVAAGYIERHGNADWTTLARAIEATAVRCGKLETFATYKNCGFRKSSHSCAVPELIENCPVPRLPLRKGDLNQLAFSLFLFLRDQCRGDLVGYIDQILADAAAGSLGAKVEDGRQALMTGLIPLHSVGPKLISLGLSNLLIAAGRHRPRWVAVGRSMIVVDTLIHNFLHRTGILCVFERSHSYGPRCYGKRGCEAVLRDIAARIDLKLIHPNLCSHNPRLVQSAVWQFCTEIGLDICNGRKIDDTQSCSMPNCPVGDGCSRICLRPAKPANKTDVGSSSSSALSGHSDQAEGIEHSTTDDPSKTSVEVADESIRGRGGYRVAFTGSGRRAKPRRQGDCDSLCGYYSIINAIRWIFRPLGGLKSVDEGRLFLSLIRAGRTKAQFHWFFAEGSTLEDVICLAKAGAKCAERIAQRPVVFKRWRSQMSSGRRAGLRMVLGQLMNKNSAVIIGIEGRTLSHWSIITKVTARSLILFDSSRMTRLPFERCQLRRRSYSKRRPRYWITVVGSLSLIENNE